MLFNVVIVYGYVGATGVCISERVQAVLKNHNEQMFRFMTREDDAQHPGLYNG